MKLPNQLTDFDLGEQSSMVSKIAGAHCELNAHACADDVLLATNIDCCDKLFVFFNVGDSVLIIRKLH